MKTGREKVFVGISGGVDSSVAAYLLKKEGYEVHGVFIKTWTPEWLPCNWVAEKRDAMRVCASLDIPFHFLDASDAYEQGVAGYMIAEYRAGRTPNPDVLCNRVIKFGVLWEYAKQQGARAIATGHYAQIINGQLARGVDAAKDQSYFLWMLTPEELAHIRFPIGKFPKREVRAIAEKAKLFTATKKDSQGVCFLGDIDMREFLSHYITQSPGMVLDEAGEVIGEHDGVLFYTIGERHGFRITAPGSAKEAHYVVAKDIERNALIVSTKKRNPLQQGSTVTIRLREVQWMGKPDRRKKYDAQIRYHGTLLSAVVKTKDTVVVKTTEPLPLGQSIVLYEGPLVLGGAIIDTLVED